MKVDVAWGQIQGERKAQEDRAACLSWPNGYHLLVVADGMGGHAAGQVASETVVSSFRKAFVRAEGLAPRERLLEALQQANFALFDRIQAEPDLAGMGTTLAAAASDGEWLQWVSVGDSPLWLIRGEEMRRLNEDHSVGGTLDRSAAAGEIPVDAAEGAPGRSRLLEAVLGEDIRRVDAPAEPVRLLPGDIVILASDGVETCSSGELWQLAQAHASRSSETVGAILDQVERHERPAQDNATVIVLRISAPPGEDEEAAPSRACYA